MESSNRIIQKIQTMAKKHENVAVLWLYGSRAKGLEQADSDYDLAVAFNHFPDDAWQQRLQPENLAHEWAEELDLEEKKLSVIDINHVPIQLAMAVIEHGKLLQSNNELRLIKEENRITSMWEIDHMYHRKQYG
mgnify:CR=1 FL=1